MIGRDRRYGRGRQVSLKAKVGIATAVLVGGGAIGVAAATSSHSPSSATNAGYAFSHNQFSHNSRTMSQSQLLALLLASRSQTTTLNSLSNLTSARNFVQVRVGRQILAAQRGVVVIATKNFLVVQSANGQYHVWTVRGTTKFTNATTMTSTNAITANTWAARQAMNGTMTPAINLLSNLGTVNSMMNPVTSARTVTVNIAGTGVTVSVTVTTNNVATMNTWTNGRLTNTTRFQNLLLAIKNAQARNTIARGDIAVVAGTRVGNWLQAKTVVFTPAATPSSTGINTGVGTSTGTSTSTNTGGTSYNSVTGESGTKS